MTRLSLADLCCCKLQGNWRKKVNRKATWMKQVESVQFVKLLCSCKVIAKRAGLRFSVSGCVSCSRRTSVCVCARQGGDFAKLDVTKRECNLPGVVSWSSRNSFLLSAEHDTEDELQLVWRSYILSRWVSCGTLWVSQVRLRTRYFIPNKLRNLVIGPYDKCCRYCSLLLGSEIWGSRSGEHGYYTHLECEPCSLVETYRRFVRSYTALLEGRRQM